MLEARLQQHERVVSARQGARRMAKRLEHEVVQSMWWSSAVHARGPLANCVPAQNVHAVRGRAETRHKPSSKPRPRSSTPSASIIIHLVMLKAAALETPRDGVLRTAPRPATGEDSVPPKVCRRDRLAHESGVRSLDRLRSRRVCIVTRASALWPGQAVAAVVKHVQTTNCRLSSLPVAMQVAIGASASRGRTVECPCPRGVSVSEGPRTLAVHARCGPGAAASTRERARKQPYMLRTCFVQSCGAKGP